MKVELERLCKMNSVHITVVFGLPLAFVYTVKCIYHMYTIEVKCADTFMGEYLIR